MTGRFWREAASLMVVGRAAQISPKLNLERRLSEADYSLVFLKRSQKSSFLPNNYVFPGGVVDPSDFSTAWLDVFEKCGYSNSELKELRTGAPLPRVYQDKPDHYIMPEVGFRITAIRETFEESGLLLASHLPENCLTQDDIKRWMNIVHQDATQFVTLFREVGGCPAVWDLHEWITYLTPVHFGNRRFDTPFYITFLDTLPRVVIDKMEIVGLQVLSPQSVLEKWYNKAITLPPPQFYEVSRLLNFHRFDDLKRFAEERGKKGMDQYFAVRFNVSDGIISLMPGDELYPDQPDYTGDLEIPNIQSSLEELRNSATKLNRIEIRSMSDMRVFVNIQLEYGHVQPVTI